MTWLLDLVLGLVPDIWPYIAGAVALVGGWFVAKRQGAKGERAKQAERTVKAVQAGAKGAAKAEADLTAGKTPQHIKEENDAKWR